MTERRRFLAVPHAGDRAVPLRAVERSTGETRYPVE